MDGPKILRDAQAPLPDPGEPFEPGARSPRPGPDVTGELPRRSPRDAKLTRGMRADRAVRLIAHRHLQRMLANQPGALLDLDPEHLHDVRVSVRRTRTLLTQTKGVLSREVVKHFDDRFEWLAELTGPVRDCDVMLEHLDGYQQQVSPSLAAGAEVLQTELVDRKVRLHALMVPELGSERFDSLIADWIRFLDSPLQMHPLPAQASRPVEEVAQEQITRIALRIFEARGKIDSETPLSRLHHLRLRFKKLRYMIESFADLYPRKRVQRTLAELEVVQDDLGSLNDARVHREMLRTVGRDVGGVGKAYAEMLMASGEISHFLGGRVDQMRVRFARDFKHFTRAKNRERYRTLVAG